MLWSLCNFPCKISPGKKYDVTGYFYNPNIHPYKEFKQRLTTLKEYAAQAELPLLTYAGYPLEEFLHKALGAKNSRCEVCYETRLV